jgi:membrane protein DedA with SNARE-associated domain
MSELITFFIENYGTLAIFFLMFFNGLIGMPPSELILSLAGIIAYTSGINFFYILLMGTIGNVIGTYIVYFIGSWIGYQWLIDFRSRLLLKNKSKLIVKLIPNESTFIFLTTKFNNNEAKWIGIFRCVPVIRSIISLPAGMIKMPHHIFASYTFSGMFIWALLWQTLGYYFGHSLKFESYKSIISLSLILILVILLFIFKNKMKHYVQVLTKRKQ